MTPSEIAACKARLEAMLAELAIEDDLGKEGQKTVTLDQQATGRLSRMDALQHQAMAKAQKLRRDQAEQRIKAALTRIESGEYGFCQDCGEDIEPARLDIDPTLFRCISCVRG